ncbi:MAG: lysophospholipid acyltransferase family protein [Coriobacteriia bacterium]
MNRFVLARVVRATLGRVVLLLFRTRVTGAENIPGGGALLAGNHVSYMDPVLLWCASPRPVHFMAKRELWESPVIRWLLPRLWGFPVNRGEADRAAITTATSLLSSGELVGVFPEGSRSSDANAELGEAHGGAAFIALRAGVPVVPVAFTGTEKVWPRGRTLPRLARTAIRIGAPVLPAEVLPQGGRKERVEALTRLVMERIAEELAHARRAAP